MCFDTCLLIFPPRTPPNTHTHRAISQTLPSPPIQNSRTSLGTRSAGSTPLPVHQAEAFTENPKQALFNRCSSCPIDDEGSRSLSSQRVNDSYCGMLAPMGGGIRSIYLSLYVQRAVVVGKLACHTPVQNMSHTMRVYGCTQLYFYSKMSLNLEATTTPVGITQITKLLSLQSSTYIRRDCFCNVLGSDSAVSQ